MTGIATGILTGGATVWLKVAGFVVAVGLIVGAYAYVHHLNTEIHTLTTNNALLQSAVNAEKEKNDELTQDIAMVQSLNKGLSVRFSALDTSRITFSQTVQTSVKHAVEQVKTAKGDPVVTKTVSDALNAQISLNLRCTDVATAGPTDADKKDPGLQKMCPEVLGDIK